MVHMQGGGRRAGYLPQVGPGVLGGTLQRVPKPANAADVPFSAACHQRPYFLNTSSMVLPARNSSFMLRSAW